jgi:hypothetical protein
VPLPACHTLTTVGIVMLSIRSAFWTPEVSDKLLQMAPDIGYRL